MKYTLIILFSFASFFASAQSIDSTQIPQTITVTLRHMSYVKDCIGESGAAPYFKFFRAVAAQVDTSVYSPNQSITVTVPSSFVYACYVAVASQQERIGNPINDEIKGVLLPQLTNGWLLRTLQAYGQNNAKETEDKVQRGYQYFKSIK